MEKTQKITQHILSVSYVLTNYFTYLLKKINTTDIVL